MAKLGVSILLPFGDEDRPPLTIRFTALDDLHPDSLFKCLDVLKAVSENRKKLSDPSSFAQAAEVLQKVEKPPAPPASPREEDRGVLGTTFKAIDRHSP
jgi:hypothetical protein